MSERRRALRRALGAVLLMLALASVGPAVARSRAQWVAKDGIDITDLLRERIAAVAAIYFKKTGRTLEITSGYRSPTRQALAMYTKLALGGSLAIYKNQALVDPLRKAYREGRKKRWPKDRIVAAMAGVLADQVARGIYLSRHMRGRAFDVRSSGMSGRQRAALRAAIEAVGDMRIIYESRPPHFHVEIIDRQAPDDHEGANDDEGDETGAPANKDSAPDADGTRPAEPSPPEAPKP